MDRYVPSNVPHDPPSQCSVTPSSKTSLVSHCPISQTKAVLRKTRTSTQLSHAFQSSSTAARGC